MFLPSARMVPSRSGDDSQIIGYCDNARDAKEARNAYSYFAAIPWASKGLFK